LKFAVYYEDGSIYFGETEEDAMNAPTKSAQITKMEVPDAERGFSLKHGSDFHCWYEFHWSGRDRDGMIDYILHCEGPQKIIMGRAIYDKTYKAICKKVLQDGCFCEGSCDHIKEGMSRRKGD